MVVGTNDQKELEPTRLARTVVEVVDEPIPGIELSLGEHVRIGALAFSQEDTTDARPLDLEDLVDALHAVNASRKGFTAHIILCSAASFYSAARGASTALARRIVKLAGCLVAIEAPDDEDRSRWVLATERGFVLLRQTQHVKTQGDIAKLGPSVLAEFAAGLGRIPVQRGERVVCELVLFICGEGRLLATGGDASVFGCDTTKLMTVAADGTRQLPEVFRRRSGMVALNPAHRPSLHHSHHEAFHLLDRWRMNKRSRLALYLRAVLRGWQTHRDGSCGPRAIVRSGPFRRGNTRDISVAVRAFVAPRSTTARIREGQRTHLAVNPAAALEAIYAEFAV